MISKMEVIVRRCVKEAKQNFALIIANSLSLVCIRAVVKTVRGNVPKTASIIGLDRAELSFIFFRNSVQPKLVEKLAL